jgi:hypothetical protein
MVVDASAALAVLLGEPSGIEIATESVIESVIGESVIGVRPC